jgi:hypothetical protein
MLNSDLPLEEKIIFYFIWLKHNNITHDNNHKFTFVNKINFVYFKPNHLLHIKMHI